MTKTVTAGRVGEPGHSRTRYSCCNLNGGNFAAPSILPMDYVPALVTFVLAIGALYHFVGRRRTPGEGPSIVLAVAAAFPLLHGGALIWKELDRLQYGRVETGVIVGKLSSTGEAHTRTLGGHRFSRPAGRRRQVPDINTADGFRLDDVVARVMLTGSRNAYFVEYRHPCESATGCYEREEVRYPMWTQLTVGQTVDVRTIDGRPERARLDINSPISIALAKLALAGVLALAARAMRPRRLRSMIA